jgi:hypothetical protein
LFLGGTTYVSGGFILGSAVFWLFKSFMKLSSQPRSNNPAWKLTVPGNSGGFVEAVFRPVPVGKHRKLRGIHRKKIRPISDSEYCFHVQAISGAFL